MDPIDRQNVDIINRIEPRDFSDSQVYSSYFLVYYNMMSIDGNGQLTEVVGKDNAWFLLDLELGHTMSLRHGMVSTARCETKAVSWLAMITDGDTWYHIINDLNGKYKITSLDPPAKPPPKQIVQKLIKRIVSYMEF